jgi:hypothetical protein
MERKMSGLGKKIDKSKMTTGVPPVVLQAQPDGFIKLSTPDELKQWEEDVKNFYGIAIDASRVQACETCSGGCSDDCGMM